MYIQLLRSVQLCHARQGSLGEIRGVRGLAVVALFGACLGNPEPSIVVVVIQTKPYLIIPPRQGLGFSETAMRQMPWAAKPFLIGKLCVPFGLPSEFTPALILLICPHEQTPRHMQTRTRTLTGEHATPQA